MPWAKVGLDTHSGAWSCHHIEYIYIYMFTYSNNVSSDGEMNMPHCHIDIFCRMTCDPKIWGGPIWSNGFPLGYLGSTALLMPTCSWRKSSICLTYNRKFWILSWTNMSSMYHYLSPVVIIFGATRNYWTLTNSLCICGWMHFVVCYLIFHVHRLVFVWQLGSSMRANQNAYWWRDPHDSRYGTLW